MGSDWEISVVLASVNMIAQFSAKKKGRVLEEREQTTVDSSDLDRCLWVRMTQPKELQRIFIGIKQN